MALYVAYGLVVMHVALGVMQNDRNPLIPAMLAGGFAWVTLLHLVAGWREWAGDRAGACGSDGSPLRVASLKLRCMASLVLLSSFPTSSVTPSCARDV